MPARPKRSDLQRQRRCSRTVGGTCAAHNMNRSSVIDLTDESPTSQPRSVPDEDVSVLNVRLVSPPYRTRRRRQRRPVVDVDAMPEAPAGQHIHEGIPTGPYTRRVRRAPVSHADRTRLMERLEMLASRYVARAHQHGTPPQTLLRPYAEAPAVTCGHAMSPPALPKRFDRTWTHPLAPSPGFSQSIIEPAIDVERVSSGDRDAVAPIPNTTPICARCQHALILNGVGEDRIWALPCGHVIDGRCVAQLSDAASGKRHVFTCPVPQCKQRCHPEPGHSHSCIEVYS